MSEEDYVSMESYDRLMSEKDRLEAQLRAAEGMEKALEEIEARETEYTEYEARIAREARAAWRKARK